MDTTKPNPQRFATYVLSTDGKTFTIKNCKFIFKIDRYGGWRDQYGHYYNCNGQPDFEPEDAELTPSEGSVDSHDAGGDDYDEYEPDYNEDDHQEEYSSWEVKNMEKISKNMQTLSTYPYGKQLRVYFSNMSFKTPPKSVYQAYSKKVNGIKNIVFDLENNRRNGQGYFVMEDATKAEDLIRLQGQKVIDREAHFDVEKINDLIMDPIKEQESNPFWVSQKNKQAITEKKDDIPRFKAAPAEETKPKKQQQKKQVKKQVKTQGKLEAKKSQPIIQQEVKKQKQTEVDQFKKYILNFEVFSAPKVFYAWLNQNGYTKDIDIKNVCKQQKNGAPQVTLDAKTSVVKKLNGKQYNGKQVKFTLT